MIQNAFGQITDRALAAGDETQEAALPHCTEDDPTFSVASNPIVQCLLIAARRGRQIRLARAAQLQQSVSELVSEETRQSDGT